MLRHPRTKRLCNGTVVIQQSLVLGGLASGIAIEGVREVEWTMKTDDGKFRTL